MLGSVGYEVATSPTVRGGLESALKNTPGVVLTDWRLPDGDGLSVADGLRQHHALRHVPLIAVTGVSMSSQKRTELRSRGFIDVLVKPASPDNILRAIHDATEIGIAYRLRAAARRLGRYASQASRHRTAGIGAAAATIDTGRLLTRAAERSGNDITLVLANDAARYVAAAGSARELTGYEPQELVSLSVWDLAPVPEERSVQGLWRSFIESGTQEGRYMLRRRDGAPVEAQYCAVANVVPGLHLSAIARASQLPAGF